MDEAATVIIPSLCFVVFVQIAQSSPVEMAACRLPANIIVVLQLLGYTGKEKQGQDGSVNQTCDVQVGVNQLNRNDNFSRLEIGMADAKMAEGLVLVDQW
jgi:hypothetical protein